MLVYNCVPKRENLLNLQLDKEGEQFSLTKLQWNPVNTTIIGPKYFGRNNGGGRINGIRDQITAICF